MTQQIINQSFKDWSFSRNFPFTDDSDLTCTDGRRIPVSAFVCITVFPDTEGDVYISNITKDTIILSIGNDWTSTAYFADLLNNWMPIKHNGNIVGSIMVNTDDAEYLRGIAVINDMTFTYGHAVLRPELIKGFCSDTPTLFEPPTFFSESSIGMTYTLGSARYTINNDKVDMDVTVSYTPDTTAITKIKVNGTEYSLCDDGHLLIRTPIWCDTQFITRDGGLVFHQRGA